MSSEHSLAGGERRARWRKHLRAHGRWRCSSPASPCSARCRSTLICPRSMPSGRNSDAPQLAVQQTLSVYLFTYAFMMLWHGALADALGRRPVVIASLALYAITTLGCAIAGNIETLWLFRALQGVCAGAGLVVGRAVIRDRFHGAEAQRLMARITLVFGIAPAIAPVLGGVLLNTLGWRSIFWTLLVARRRAAHLVAAQFSGDVACTRPAVAGPVEAMAQLLDGSPSPGFSAARADSRLEFRGVLPLYRVRAHISDRHARGVDLRLRVAVPADDSGRHAGCRYLRPRGRAHVAGAHGALGLRVDVFRGRVRPVGCLVRRPRRPLARAADHALHDRKRGRRPERHAADARPVPDDARPRVVAAGVLPLRAGCASTPVRSRRCWRIR